MNQKILQFAKESWKKKSIQRWILLAFIVLQFFFLIAYCYKYHFASAMFESDAASELLLAENIYKNGGIVFSDDWFYSTEIRVLHNQLIMAPLFHFTSNYNLIYTAGVMIWTVGILFSVYFCVRSYGGNPTQGLLGMLLFLIPYGSYRRYSPFSMHLMNGYYSFFLLNTFLFLGLYQQYIKAKDKGRKIFLCAVLFIFSILLGCCGVRYALLIFAPLMLGEILEFAADCGKESFRNLAVRWMHLLPILFGGMAGYLLYAKKLAPVYGGTQYASNLAFASGERSLEQLQQVYNSVWESLGFSWDGGNVVSVLGIINLIFLAFTLIVFFLTVTVWKNWRSLESVARKFVFFAGCQILVNVASLVFALVEDYGAIPRYLWVGGICCLPTLVLTLGNRRAWRKAICAGGIFLCLCGNVQLWAASHPDGRLAQSYGDTVFTQYYRTVTAEERQEYMSFLRENDYHLGCSTFWNANITTVLMNDETRMIPVADDEGLSDYTWLTSKSLLENRSGAEFLLLFRSEEAERIQAGKEIPGEKVYEDEWFAIYDWRSK